MGADYISKTKKTHRKGWDRAKRKLSLDELFSQMPNKIRTILITPFDPSDPSKFCEGGVYELQVEVDRIFVYSKRAPIGVCKETPRSVVKAVAALGGKTLGLFYKKQEHSGLVEVGVCLEIQSNTQVA
ncbi:MAG: hypothetical protein WCF57_02080 [Pyrinomonadaceae bacterium]